jgi:hypothetical protein
MTDPHASRRALLLAPLLAALPDLIGGAAASPLNPAQTIVRLPDTLQWHGNKGAPPNSVDMCPLVGDTDGTGLYYTLVRWWPGYMSAPHRYVTDRLCVVVSGTWWCNSGADFDPASCVPVPAGSFVHRIAGTWHYDGVVRSHKEPVVIAICGIAPIKLELADPKLPLVRAV